jgi:HTH-type transcriptional regulator / antitoxin HipB
MDHSAKLDVSAFLRTPNDIGSLMRAKRKELGWDQSTLAGKIGVTRLWVSQVESGKPGASLGRVLQALSSLGLMLQASDNQGMPNTIGQMAAVEPIDLDAILAAARTQTSS